MVLSGPAGPVAPVAPVGPAGPVPLFWQPAITKARTLTANANDLMVFMIFGFLFFIVRKQGLLIIAINKATGH